MILLLGQEGTAVAPLLSDPMLLLQAVGGGNAGTTESTVHQMLSSRHEGNHWVGTVLTRLRVSLGRLWPHCKASPTSPELLIFKDKLEIKILPCKNVPI